MTSSEAETDRAVHDFLAILVEHKRNCERAGKYIEADIAKKRLEELRQHEENRRDESLRSRQVAQRLGIEEAHMLEFQQFNVMWDRTMKVWKHEPSRREPHFTHVILITSFHTLAHRNMRSAQRSCSRRCASATSLTRAT